MSRELFYNVSDYWEWRRKRDADPESVKTPEQRLKGAQRVYDGELRLAFVKALIASDGLVYFQARCAASSNPRAIYLETCAELGMEAAGIDS